MNVHLFDIILAIVILILFATFIPYFAMKWGIMGFQAGKRLAERGRKNRPYDNITDK